MARPDRHLYFGYNPPFLGGPLGVLSPQYDEELIKNDMVLLLLTLPGERRHRPRFGTRLRSAVFDFASEQDLLVLRQDVLHAIAQNDERVRVDDLVLEFDEGRKQLSVRLWFSLTGNPAQSYFVGLGISDSAITTIEEGSVQPSRT
jgi:phage baseplate assembly protein W